MQKFFQPFFLVATLLLLVAAHSECSQIQYNPCAGKHCGDVCTVCAPDDRDCAETAVVKACNQQSNCVTRTADLCRASDYDPCHNKECGESCRVCAPNTDCFETAVVKSCDSSGKCVSGTDGVCEM